MKIISAVITTAIAIPFAIQAQKATAGIKAKDEYLKKAISLTDRAFSPERR